LEATEKWITSVTDHGLEMPLEGLKTEAMFAIASELQEARQRRDSISRQLKEHVAEHQC
jgi:hypothetical protein